jgi:hypothetical protein
LELLAGFTLAQIGLALLATAGSAFVRGLTGFGMAILLVPILALALTPMEAVLLANFLSLFIGLAEIRTLVANAERSAWSIAALVLLATPLGMLALLATPPDVARLLIALIALSAFFAVLLPRRDATVPGRLTTGATGLASGLLTGFAAMPGPPVVPYYVGRDIPRQVAKASMMLIFTIASAVGLASATVMQVISWHVALLALLLFPAVLLGNLLGHRASGRIEDRLWRTCVGVTLAAAAVAAVVRLF